jgi:hypothetical protein
MAMFWVPLFVRGFAVGTLSISLLYSLGSVMDFMVFFQSLAIFQAIHLMVGGVVGSAIYSYGIRYLMADRIAHYGGYLDSVAASGLSTHGGNFGAALAQHIGEMMEAFQISAVKQLYGYAAFVAIALLLAILLYDTPLMRDRTRLMPPWSAVGAWVKRRAMK